MGQGFHNLKNTGVANTFFATTNYLKKRRAREARE